MQISGKNDIEKIKGFFKSSILIDDIMEILKYKVDSLIGIDTISANILKKSGVNTIKDLAELPDDKILEKKEIPADILEKWISIAKLIQEFISSSRFAQKKVLLIGLDNGGKTSILNVVQDKYSMVKNILPTRGVQREQLDFFGFGVVSWDLGGQIQYRENLYFKRPELYFSEADLLLYVVDVQDPKRFVESANYLKIVLQVLEDLNEKPELLIILNKFDPDLKNDKITLANVESAKTKFNNMVKDYGVESLDFVNTTIFESFTIKQMFSVALKKISETSEIIEKILSRFSDSINGRAISIISTDGLIFGSFAENETDETLINNTALLMQTLLSFHSKVGLLRENSMVLEYRLNKFSIRGEKLFEYSDKKIPVYLWLLSEDVSLLDEKLNYFTTEIMPLINLFV